MKILEMMSTEIEPEKPTSVEKLEPPYKSYESCMIGKQHFTPSCLVNSMHIFKYAN